MDRRTRALVHQTPENVNPTGESQDHSMRRA
jgi:hypothetical protein